MAQLTLREPSRRSLRVQTAALLAAVAALIGAAIVTSGLVSSSLDQIGSAASRARDQAEIAEGLVTTLLEAETGQRGYLLTERQTYLEPYERASEQIGPLLVQLDALAAGTPWLQPQAARLQGTVREKMAELAETLRVSRESGFAAARSLVLTDAGREHMEAARRIAAGIIHHAESERAAQAAALQSKQRLISGLALGSLLAGLVLLVTLGVRLLWIRAALIRARATARAEAQRLQTAIEQIRDGVAVFDRDNRLILQNARFAPALGLAKPPAPGTRLEEVAGSVTLDPPALSGPHPSAQPLMVEVIQAGRTLELWRSAMPDDGQIVAVADISRRVEAEAIARQAQKMEVIGQMTGGIAHDFNNLLQVVSGNLELASQRLARSGTEPTVLRRLEAASSGVARGARLIRQLLAFARRQPLAPHTVDPVRLLLSMEDMLRRTLGEAVELRLTMGKDVWPMRADPNQMESALLNLALNARDAMTRDGVPSGRVIIEVANTWIDEAGAVPDELSPGPYVVFTVSDDGTGMTEEQLNRALEPFYTTKPEGKGTGLGLPMVFGFAKQSGGHFQLESVPGAGTRARLYLPRTTEAAEPALRPESDVERGRGELVLLVEDDVAVRRVARSTLEELGYAVEEAGTADAAIRKLEAGIRPALLFSDIVLPGRLGARDLADHARRAVPGLAVLFTSGYAQDGLADEQFEASTTVLAKPWRSDQLGRAVRAALDAAQGHPGANRRRRVLLVEDDALIRITTADALSELGFEVVEAGTGATALSRLQPMPDLVIIDLGLPDTSGTELIARMRAGAPRLPVVVATGRSASPPEVDAVFLPKPFDVDELRSAVENAFRQRAQLTPASG